MIAGGCQSHTDGLKHAAGWQWNTGALERLVENDGDAAACVTRWSGDISDRVSFRRREAEADDVAVRVPSLSER